MKTKQIMLGGLLLAVLTANAETKLDHPGQGSPERKAILDAIRSTTQAQLGIPEVQYSVHKINTLIDWAYVSVAAQRKDGKPINAKKVCAYEIHGDGCIKSIEAVLRKTNGVWKLEEYVAGATDVWQMGFCDKKDFPFEVLEMKRADMCPPGYGESMPPEKK